VKHFAHKSRLRSVISVAISAAMIISLIVVPAFASTDATLGTLNAGTTGIAGYVTTDSNGDPGTSNPGLNGTVSIAVTGTPGVNAFQVSAASYTATGLVTPVNQLSTPLNVITDTEQLRVTVVDIDAGNPALWAPSQTPRVYWDATMTVTPTMTVQGVVDQINSYFAGLDLTSVAADAASARLLEGYFRVTATQPQAPSAGQAIRLTKTRAGNGSLVFAWDMDTPGADANPGVADVLFGEGIDWTIGSGAPNGFGVGTSPSNYSVDATFTPINGNAYSLNTPGTGVGAFDSATPFTNEFNLDGVDPVTGQFTGLLIDNGWATPWDNDWYIPMATANRATVMPGTITFDLGQGVRNPRYTEDDTEIVPNTGNNTIGTAVAGKVETYTVMLDHPHTSSGEALPLQGTINGIRVLYPKGFSFAPSNYATSSAQDDGYGAQSVTTSNTEFGPMVTIENIQWPAVHGPNEYLDIYTALTAPTKAGLYGPGAGSLTPDDGLKVWVRNVGTGLDQWVPLFCDPNNDGPLSIQVAPDTVSRVDLVKNADNRADGKVLLTATAYDKFDNVVPGVVFNDPAINNDVHNTGSLARTAPGENSWVWNLSEVPMVNTATLTYTVGLSTFTDAVSVDTVGVGEPAQVIIEPVGGKTAYAYNDALFVSMKLVDANGKGTSWMDDHDWHVYSALAVEQDGDEHGTSQKYFNHGWSQSANSFSTSALPGTFEFSGLNPLWGEQAITLVAQANAGMVLEAPFTTITVAGEPSSWVHGVPVGVKVVADKPTPGDWAVNDDVYNNRGWYYLDKEQFGWALADGSDAVTFTVQVVDAFGDPVTGANVTGKNVYWDIERFTGTRGTFPTGQSYETVTDANGRSTASVKSFRATTGVRSLPGWSGPWGDDSWFTPVYVEVEDVTTAAQDWAHPCTSQVRSADYGFTYFHGGQMSASLEKTVEGDSKDIALVGDSVGYTAEVTDPAFGTPVAGWPIKFTTTFGSFDASGTKSLETVSGSDGKATVRVSSPDQGTAYVTAIDRELAAITDSVFFTEWATRTEVLSTDVAGDRALSRVRYWFENVKTGARLMWDNLAPIYSLTNGDGGENVYGHDSAGLLHNTNQTINTAAVDTNADGKYDAYETDIPALDDSYTKVSSVPRLESAGERYALIEGSFWGGAMVNNVFYNGEWIWPAPARPTTTFVKTADLAAETSQFSDYVSVRGAGYTPGKTAPEMTDWVEVFLGDITSATSSAKYIGRAPVGRDGQLLPTGVWDYYNDDYLRRMSPGLYDITVDGLVFKNGLEVKNWFKESWISIDNKTPEVSYLDGSKDHKVQVNAFGGNVYDVYGGSLMLRNYADGEQTWSTYVLPAGSQTNGLHNLSAKIRWDDSYITRVVTKYYIIHKMSFSSVKVSASGRKLNISGSVKAAAEANGSKNFAVKLTIQKRVNGVWKKYGSKTVSTNGAATNAYSTTYTVKSAGTYRVVASHSDAAHSASSKTSSSKSVK
jgi:hypothetical protein